MRIFVAIVLALVGFAVFPFSVHTLSTVPGLMLAIIGVALFFFAYRIATHKKKG